MLSDCLDHYWEFARHKILNKSDDQIRKWRNPRIKAINNFIKVIGDKAVGSLTRQDTLLFRNWWLDRFEKEKMATGSVNKDIIHVKTILSLVSQNMEIDLDITSLFQGLTLQEKQKTKRLPFSTPYLKELLNENSFSGLNKEAKLAVFILADTGMRPSELTGLKPEDIIIGNRLEKEIKKAKTEKTNTDIPPHIRIVPDKGKELKTTYSERKIPLTGWALWAFEQLPDGMQDYYLKSDQLSTCINKYMKSHNFYPTAAHTLYSFRHSFQDRMNEAAIPDRIQTQLFGHKFDRPEYGQGVSLRSLHEWMEKIKLKS
jgi:integrase